LPKKYKSKLTKVVAYKKLEGVLLRLKTWNEQHSNYYKIEEAALIGSLARDGESFGDIDICMKIKRSREFSPSKSKNDYIRWREQVLGYKPPVSESSAERGMFELDVGRYIKNRDGRIDMLRWDQFQPICLTLQPYVKLVEKCFSIVDSVEYIEKQRATFSKEQALEVVNSGLPEKPYDTKGIYWESYCSALNRYPSFIRYAVLERDSYVEPYSRYINVE